VLFTAFADLIFSVRRYACLLYTISVCLLHR